MGKIEKRFLLVTVIFSNGDWKNAKSVTDFPPALDSFIPIQTDSTRSAFTRVCMWVGMHILEGFTLGCIQFLLTIYLRPDRRAIFSGHPTNSRFRASCWLLAVSDWGWHNGKRPMMVSNAAQKHLCDIGSGEMEKHIALVHDKQCIIHATARFGLVLSRSSIYEKRGDFSLKIHTTVEIEWKERKWVVCWVLLQNCVLRNEMWMNNLIVLSNSLWLHFFLSVLKILEQDVLKY